MKITTFKEHIRGRSNISDKILTIFIYIFITVFTLFCLIPFWLVFINSFATESSISSNGFILLPKHFSLDAYRFLLKSPQTIRSFGVSIFVTVVGTGLAILITTMLAYVIACYKVKYRNIIGFMVYFTMVFGSGLVGFYIMISNWLHLKDNIFAMILPYLLNPFYAFILVSFFRTVPRELIESATVDGANDAYAFFKIIWPISTPVIATVGLFYSLMYWNDWWLATLFIDNSKLHPLQMMIRQLMANINIASYVGGGTNYTTSVPALGMQLAIVCVTIGPIILVYPRIQKYFVKGLTIGAVKG